MTASSLDSHALITLNTVSRWFSSVTLTVVRFRCPLTLFVVVPSTLIRSAVPQAGSPPDPRVLHVGPGLRMT